MSHSHGGGGGWLGKWGVGRGKVAMQIPIHFVLLVICSSYVLSKYKFLSICGQKNNRILEMPQKWLEITTCLKISSWSHLFSLLLTCQLDMMSRNVLI